VHKMLTLRGAMPRETTARLPLCADIDGFSLHAAVRVDAAAAPLQLRLNSRNLNDLIETLAHLFKNLGRQCSNWMLLGSA